MARAIYQTRSGFTAGSVALGIWGHETGSIRQEVIDGDTVNVQAPSNFGVRFLGVDAPEKKAQLKDPDSGKLEFKNLDNVEWKAFLNDPLDSFEGDQGLINYLQDKVGPDAAMNQYQYAEAAEDALEEEISRDLDELGKSIHSFRFFLAFSHEVMDRYGRFLCFINRHQEDSEDRPGTYNERLLEKGAVSPYFIWPNINPFRNKSLTEAVLDPEIIRGDKSLSAAREWVRNARQKKSGIFDADNPLMLQPFEVRFLGRGCPPDRWVTDLSKNHKVLIKPENYYTIPNVEDRLFVPKEYQPLFESKGWQSQS